MIMVRAAVYGKGRRRAGRRENAAQAGRLTSSRMPGVVIIAAMVRSTVRLPREVRDPFQVYLNGVAQQLGTDYVVREGALVFERDLRKDKISGWRWLLGAWGVGTYRQNESVGVPYEAADGSPRVAEALEIEEG